MVGPPGSGKETQARMLANQYGMVHISVKQILRAEIQRSPEVGKVISECIEKGEPFPDNIVNHHIEKRLKQSDCKVNGWVLDGFPNTKQQINLLKAMRIKPTSVFIFEQPEDECVRRLGNKRMDPTSGELFNLEVNPPGEDAVSSRLIELQEDAEDVVRRRFEHWKPCAQLVEESFRSCVQTVQSERTVEEMNELVADAIANPL